MSKFLSYIDQNNNADKREKEIDLLLKNRKFDPSPETKALQQEKLDLNHESTERRLKINEMKIVCLKVYKGLSFEERLCGPPEFENTWRTFILGVYNSGFQLSNKVDFEIFLPPPDGCWNGCTKYCKTCNSCKCSCKCLCNEKCCSYNKDYINGIIQYEKELVQRKISIILKDLLDEMNLINIMVEFLTLKLL